MDEVLATIDKGETLGRLNFLQVEYGHCVDIPEVMNNTILKIFTKKL